MSTVGLPGAVDTKSDVTNLADAVLRSDQITAIDGTLSASITSIAAIRNQPAVCHDREMP